MFEFVPVSPRMQEMKDTYRSTERYICVERYRLITDFYKENMALNAMIRRARAFEYLCENMPVRIDPWDVVCGAATSKFGAGLLYPEICCDWLPAELADGSIRTRKSDPYQISDEDAQYIIDTIDFWKDKSLSAMCSASLPEGYKKHAGNGVSVFGLEGRAATCIGHFCPNFEKVIHVGFQTVKDDADTMVRNIEENGLQGDTAEQYYFYQGVSIVCDAMMKFAMRYSKKAAEMRDKEKDPKRREELNMMSESLGRIMREPCKTFYDAIEAVFLYQIALALDGSLNGLSVGRLDQYLGEFYERDLANGTITPEYAQELMDNFFLKIAEVCKVSSANNSESFPGYTSGQLITIGGVKKDGTDATNAVTYMAIQSAGRLLLHDPPVALRVHKGTPQELWEAAIESTKRVGGVPTFENDDDIIPTLLARGFSHEDALNYCIIGCVEPGGTGCDWPQTGGTGTEPYFILPNVLLLAINNGYVTDPRTLEMHLIKSAEGKETETRQVGLPTGYLYDMTSFDQVLTAVRKQMEFFAKWHVANTNQVDYIARSVIPIPLASAMTEGCMESGKDVLSGGAKYNSTGVAGVGFGNLVDSLQLIKHLCFDEKKCTTRELYDAIINDWNGYEDLRAYIKGSAPHYGNAENGPDEYVDWVANTYAEAFATKTGPRGKYSPGLWPVATHILFGKTTGATPDGRKAGSTLSEGISPVQQMDVNGPTAVLRSAAKFSHKAQTNGTLLNLRFHPAALKGEEGDKKLSELMRTYFDMGGMELQLNVISSETLRKAQKEPDEYKNLVVRVAGFSTYFVSLNNEAQEELISRTENTI